MSSLIGMTPVLASLPVHGEGPADQVLDDVASRVDLRDLAAAETRITDLETRWDEAEATLHPKDPEAWGNVDAAADDAFAALRTPRPEAAAVERTTGASRPVITGCTSNRSRIV